VTSEDAIFLGLGSTGALLARAWLLPPILLATEFRALTNAQRQLISVRELLPAPVSVLRLCLPCCFASCPTSLLLLRPLYIFVISVPD
jgi:hypothetical protein